MKRSLLRHENSNPNKSLVILLRTVRLNTKKKTKTNKSNDICVCALIISVIIFTIMSFCIFLLRNLFSLIIFSRLRLIILGILIVILIMFNCMIILFRVILIIIIIILLSLLSLLLLICFHILFSNKNKKPSLI